jgi:hypothetical protein
MDDKKIKRDEHNRLDKDDTERVIKKVTEDLINTERDFQRDLTFLKNRENRRDVVVKVIVYQKNTVNGKIVKDDYKNPLFEKLSEDPLDAIRYRMFDYMDGEIFVKEMPMRQAEVGRWTMGCFKVVVNYLCRMGVFNA